MKNCLNLPFRWLLQLGLFAFVFAYSISVYAAAPAKKDSVAKAGAAPATADAIKGDPATGEKLFKANCTSCHKINSQLIGPALKGVTDRRPVEWLHKWIKNNQAVMLAGDPYAKELYAKYNQSNMTVFASFTDGDVDNILSYIKQESAPKVEAVAAGGASANPNAGIVTTALITLSASLTVLLLLLVSIVLVLVYGLSKSQVLQDLFRKNTEEY